MVREMRETLSIRILDKDNFEWLGHKADQNEMNREKGSEEMQRWLCACFWS